MSPKQSYQEQVRERLLDFWVHREEYGHPVGCVASSYTFDAAFFEEDCLGRFVGMETQPDEDQRLYLVEREERLAQVGCVALVDVSQVPRNRSLRWNLLPVRVPGGGIQHAKVTVLIWELRVRVLVGSANLTEYGYRRNYEHMGVLDFTPEGSAPVALLEEILGFVERMAALAPGGTVEEEGGPQAALRRLFGRARSLTSSWDEALPGRSQPSVAFIGLRPGGADVLTQLSEEHWRGTGPSAATVLSPFFDEGKRAQQLVEALLGIMGKQGERAIEFWSPGRELQDGSVELGMPEVLRTPWASRVKHQFCFVPETDQETDVRPLHAKSLWLQRQARAVYMIGSSNFTCAGYGRVAGRRNVEANLVYELAAATGPFARKCEASYPAGEQVDPEVDDVTFLSELEDRTPEGDQYVALSAGFGEALFRPAGETGVVLLEFGEELPPGFAVLSGAEEVLVDRAAWEAAGRPAHMELEWTAKRPPSALEVVWEGAGGEKIRSLWVVNVTDAAGLPPPDELRELPLEILVEILTSARPLHEALRRAWRRLEQAGDKAPDVVFDPHKKVDTRNYLLRRVRRISGALEGLRHRMERPVYDEDGLRWRLHGPVGPVALARMLAVEEGEGAGFMVSEVALTLQLTDWGRAEEYLGRRAVRQEVASAIGALRQLADDTAGPENLAAYVRDSFGKVDTWLGQ